MTSAASELNYLMNIDSNSDDEKERFTFTHIRIYLRNNNNIKTITTSLQSDITKNKVLNKKTSLIGVSKPHNHRRSVLGGDFS